MAGKVTPKKLPHPRTMLGHDGTDFVAVKTDADGRPIVRGENQLLTYGGQIIAEVNGTPAGAGGNTLLGGIVPDGEVWIITSMSARAWGNPVTACYLGGRKGAVDYYSGMYGATLARVGNSWAGTMPLVKDDRPICYLDGCTAGDDIRFFYFGYWMTKET